MVVSQDCILVKIKALVGTLERHLRSVGEIISIRTLELSGDLLLSSVNTLGKIFLKHAKGNYSAIKSQV